MEDSISGRGLRLRCGGGAGAERIAELAAEGDERAIAAFASFGSDLAGFPAPFPREFRPDRVVVGGSIALAWSQFRAVLAGALDADVVPAARMHDAALLGAALHARAAN